MPELLTYSHISPSQRFEARRRRERRPVRVEDEQTQIPALALEVNKINAEGDQELYFLKRTGFQTRGQVELLSENLKSGVSLENSLQQIEQDIQAFKIEYLVEGPLFPIVLEKTEKNGETRIGGKLYGDKLWVDAVDSVERDGVVKKSVQKMEEFLIHAEPGSLVLMTSPAGWSGYEGITYPDTQTYAIQVQENGELRGFTIKTDMNLFQNKKLLEQYGVSFEGPWEDGAPKDKIKGIVSNVVTFDPEAHKTIEGVIDDIHKVKGSDTAYTDTTGRQRLFAETRKLLENPDVLWTLDETTQGLVDNLKEYINYRIQSEDPSCLQDIRVALGYTILQLMYKVRPPVQGQTMREGSRHDTKEQYTPPFDPRREANALAKIPGCAGGGSGEDGVVESVTPRRATFGEENKLDTGCSCGINIDNHYHCPKEKGGCDKKYDDETNKKRTEECDCGFKFHCKE